jgi:hypothetical protein
LLGRESATAVESRHGTLWQRKCVAGYELTSASAGTSPLERFAAVEDDLSVDGEFLEPPALDLDRLRADEPDRGDIGVGDLLVGDEAADDGPVVGLGYAPTAVPSPFEGTEKRASRYRSRPAPGADC